MKNLLPILISACFILFASQCAIAQNENSPSSSWCGNTEEFLELQKQQDPGLEDRMAKIEAGIQAWIKNPPPSTNAVVTIPVVFHILWKNTAENIPDSYITQQMSRLNKDYRKLNPDWSTKTPSAFQPMVADCEIQFCLATKDPSGNPTNGIIRKQTTNSSFSQGSDNVKFSAQGGDDIWDRNKYLNIWICNLGGISGVLGYAKPPGSAANVDGVVLKYTVLPLQDRIAVHEIGHWISPLYHPWYSGSCKSDSVADTPPQNGPTQGGCPTFPKTDACSPTSPGIMFMNFMDYASNNCAVMFTNDQKTRLHAGLNGPRAGLLTSSVTNCAPLGINNFSLSDYISIYPNPSTGDVFMNVDIPNASSIDITIFNILGEVVLSREIIISSSKEIKFDMNGKPDGIYLMEIKTSEANMTEKIVLKR